MSEFNRNPNVASPLGGFPDAPEPEGTTDCGNYGLDIDGLIESSGKASSITVDGQSVTRRSLSELIELDKHIATKQTSCRNAGGWGSIRMSKVSPPTATGS